MTRNSDDNDLWCDLSIASDSSLLTCTWTLWTTTMPSHTSVQALQSQSISQQWLRRKQQYFGEGLPLECFYLGAFDFVRVWPSKLHYVDLGFKHFSWIVARMMQLLFICLFIFFASDLYVLWYTLFLLFLDEILFPFQCLTAHPSLSHSHSPLPPPMDWHIILPLLHHPAFHGGYT